MFDLYAEVAVKLPVRSTFTYRVLNQSVKPGQRVIVPFRSSQEEGIVTEIHRNEPEYETHDIYEVCEDYSLLTREQMEIASFVSDHYLCGPGEILFKMFPAISKKVHPDHYRPSKKESRLQPLHLLNDEQKKAYETICASREKSTHLVQGITGSGKTELYIHLIIKTLQNKKSAILLVPEIALSFQMIDRLQKVFGDLVALLTSSLTRKKRFENYIRLLTGQARIAVGTRSAIFAPVQSPGIIVIDEEHDSSFRDQSAPRYDARQIARFRVSNNDCQLILGSATPRIEARYYCDAGIYERHTLRKRATGRLPEVRIVDAPVQDIPIGGDLIREVEKNIKNNEKSILLLNRRGYRPYLICKDCKEVEHCPNCTVTLNLHRDGFVKCHFCGYHSKVPEKHSCGGKFQHTGSGTQKLEEYILNLYPGVKIERLDTDSAARAGVTEYVMKRFLNNEIDILTGTQMIAKGLDHPDVTLVGVLQADRALHFPDFRAPERVFSLLMQVAGRSGRSEKPGRVIFEADDPGHSILDLARNHDYEEFFRAEIQLRKELGYPPFSRLLRLLCRSRDLNDATVSMERIYKKIFSHYKNVNTLELLGPAPAPIEKMNQQYRVHLIIKTRKMQDIRSYISKHLEELKGMVQNGHLEIEFDPMDLI